MPDANDPQREHWRAVAAAWSEWWPLIESGASPVTEAMMAMAAPVPGERVLDVACGIGEPALTVAGLVAPSGHVVATDIAPEMIALGRERAAAAGIANVEFQATDTEQLDVPAAGFDLATSRWGLMFCADLDRALDAIHQALRPDGRLVTAVWAAPEQVPMISLSMRVLREAWNLPPPGPDERSPFELADTDAFARRLNDAGFRDVVARAVEVVMRFPSLDTYIQVQRDLSRVERQAGDLPAEHRAAGWQAVRDAAAPFEESDGQVVMRNQAICLAARR